MVNYKIPELSEQEIKDCLRLAKDSAKRRYPKLLHSVGDEFNSVFNFMMQDSYMQPHLHPGEEKIEMIHIIQGKVATIFFDDHGVFKEFTVLEKGGIELIEVPAFTWHTYLILTDYAVTYETMMGVYETKTWKKFSDWSPKEGGDNCLAYIALLKKKLKLNF
jgi:cupin fold WbuC family metalloprotein